MQWLVRVRSFTFRTSSSTPQKLRDCQADKNVAAEKIVKVHFLFMAPQNEHKLLKTEPQNQEHMTRVITIPGRLVTYQKSLAEGYELQASASSGSFARRESMSTPTYTEMICD